MSAVWLTRLRLAPQDREVRRDMGDVQRLHRRVLDLFGPAAFGGEAADAGRVLWRLELQPRTGSLTLLVQSEVPPAVERLPAGYLVAGSDGATWKDVAAAHARIETQLRLRFRLRANPTKRISRGNAEQRERWRGKRVDLRREAEQLAWLARKGEAGGFRLGQVSVRPGVPPGDQAATVPVEAGAGSAGVPAVQTAPGGRTQGWRTDRNTGDRQRLTFGGVVFEGVLEVTDAEAFRRTLREGIGSGKAYGFGLLSVAPAG